MSAKKRKETKDQAAQETGETFEDVKKDLVDKATGAAADKPAEKAPKEVVPIVRGRIPIAVVFAIRFGANKDKAASDLAAMYATTVGKIDDIKKNRNFAYLTADFAPTKEMKNDAIEYLKKHPKFNDVTTPCAVLIDEIEDMPEATKEQAEAFFAARLAGRGQTTKTKDGEQANAGGGNRSKSGKKKADPKEEEAPTDAPTAEDLLG